MSRRETRRQFVGQAVTALSALALPALRLTGYRAPLVLRVGLISAPDSPTDDYRLGFELGLDEARHAASLFGGSIEDVALVSPQSSDRRLSAIVGAIDDAKTSLEWARHAADSGTVYMNVGCAADALRGSDCSRAAFHVTPSDAMLRDAVAAAGAAGRAVARAWDSTLSRFGADTLNKRFAEQFRRTMTSASWTAWFSIKALWESALRRRSADAPAIAEFLARDTTQFDGHKGTPLSFRLWDHQLRQPLYVVTDGRGQKETIVDVPKIDPDASVRDALDRLGTSKAASQCREWR